MDRDAKAAKNEGAYPLAGLAGTGSAQGTPLPQKRDAPPVKRPA